MSDGGCLPGAEPKAREGNRAHATPLLVDLICLRCSSSRGKRNLWADSRAPVVDEGDADGRLVAARHGAHRHAVQRHVPHLRPRPRRILIAQPVREQRELQSASLAGWGSVRSQQRSQLPGVPVLFGKWNALEDVCGCLTT